MGDVLGIGTPTGHLVKNSAAVTTGVRNCCANIGTYGIGATQLNLADNYTFTGTIKTTNGMDLLATPTDSSNIDYCDVNIIDYSYQSSYDTFLLISHFIILVVLVLRKYLK